MRSSRLTVWPTLLLAGALTIAGCSSDDDITNPPPQPGEGTLSGNLTSSRTLYSDTTYTLSGFVKVQNGATLTIQPGTRLIGDTTVPGSSLWILRGARIEANGTAAAPIVFTSARSVGNRKPGDWGGLIIIGEGITNRNSVTVFTEGPQGASEQYTGGNDNNSSSGTLRYVRIEFAGYDVTGTGQELNALSSYVVGRGTTYEYIQTFAGLDDSFEWWGGAVDGRYLVSYESGDDHFDWSEGYRGRNQFLIALQTQRIQPRPGTGGLSSDPQGFEADGCPTGEAGCTTGNSTQPYSVPVFANFTLVGPGTGTPITSSGDIGIVLRRGTGGFLVNGLVARWQRQGLTIRDAVTDDHLTGDSLRVVNLLLAENATNYDGGSNFGQENKFTTANHVTSQSLTAALFTSLTTPGLDWTPPAGSPAAAGAGTVAIPAGFAAGFFGAAMPNTTYFGAAAPGGAKWWQGWTAYHVCTANGC